MAKIHLFENNGYRIALDVHSGAVHMLDKPAYDLLAFMERYLEERGGGELPPVCPPEASDAVAGSCDAADAAELYAELYELQESGLLYSPDDYGRFSDRMGPAPLKAMCLHVSHDCNLRCRYCFAGQGDYGGGRQVMSADVARAAMDFLVARSAGRRNLEVDFFGGEPLMNLGVVRETVAYARALEAQHDKRFRFTMTTNGLLLDDETIAWLNAEMHNVVLSLDGRRDINDAMRPRVGGQGSYDAIVDKYRRFIEAREANTEHRDYYIRGTFTRGNLDFTEDVLHMASLGFRQLSVEPAVGDPALEFSITEENLPRIFEEYDRLARVMLERREAGDAFNFFHFMLDLDQGPCAIKRLRGCGCGNEYAAVDPEGGLYPCHQYVGRPERRMGSVLDGSYDMDIQAEFARATVFTKEPCADCWAKFYCSGGCNANNEIYEGSIARAHGLSCEMEKKRLECALMLQAARAGD